MPSLNAMAKKAKSKKPSSAKKAVKKASPPTSHLSAELIQDSDLEKDEEFDESSDSDDEESLPEKSMAAISKPNGKVVGVDVDSSSSGGDRDSVEESSSEEEEQLRGKKDVQSAKPQVPTITATPKVVPSDEAAQYKPPNGFELASLDDDEPTASRLLKKSNLNGKQIWYITAPASVPVASIKETSLGNILNGKSVLNHNGNDYGFIQDSSEDITYTKIMAPRSSDSSYRAGAKAIDRILHLQQIVKLPSVYDANAKKPSSSSTARPTIPAKKPVRQQPQGLKMRFRPLGFGSGSTGRIGASSPESESASDKEMEDNPAPFQRPASLEADISTTSSEGADASSSSDAQMTDAPPSKKAIIPTAKNVAKRSLKSAEPSLKRKHSEGDGKVKNSSSKSESSTNDRELKRIKENPTKSPVGKQSASIEAPRTRPSKPLRVTASPISPPPPPETDLTPSGQIGTA